MIQRALALRCLELPVGEFIKNTCKGDLPESEGVRALLESNIVDEEKHDLALNYAAAAHAVPEFLDEQARTIEATWTNDPHHTVLKAMVLERSVFFVLLPLFRFLGDTGLRTTSADISRDEQVHVAANTLICRELGLATDSRTQPAQTRDDGLGLATTEGQDQREQVSGLQLLDGRSLMIFIPKEKQTFQRRVHLGCLVFSKFPMIHFQAMARINTTILA